MKRWQIPSKDFGDMDAIMANNVYAHIVDIQSTTEL